MHLNDRVKVIHLLAKDGGNHDKWLPANCKQETMVILGCDNHNSTSNIRLNNFLVYLIWDLTAACQFHKTHNANQNKFFAVQYQESSQSKSSILIFWNIQKDKNSLIPNIQKNIEYVGTRNYLTFKFQTKRSILWIGRLT